MEDLREESSLLQPWFPLPSTSQQPINLYSWQLHPQPPSHAVSETDVVDFMKLTVMCSEGREVDEDNCRISRPFGYSDGAPRVELVWGGQPPTLLSPL